MENRSFARVLSDERARVGLTQEAIALASGISASYYYQIEIARRPPPSGKVLSRIVEVLELSEQGATDLRTRGIADRFMIFHPDIARGPWIRDLFRLFVLSLPTITLEQADRLTSSLEEYDMK